MPGALRVGPSPDEQRQGLRDARRAAALNRRGNRKLDYATEVIRESARRGVNMELG